MKTWKRMLSCVLALAMLVCLLPAALAADGGHWADQAVSTLNDTYNTTVFQASDDEMSLQNAKDILTAMGLKSDKLPDSGDFTRALACTVLADVFNLPVEGSGDTAAIEYLYGKNIINGYADGTLGEDEPISLAQFAVVTYRILNSIGGGAGSTTGLIPGTEEYNSWMFLVNRGVVEKNGHEGNIDETTWNEWISKLDPEKTVFGGSTPPCPGEEDETVTKLRAAVDLVNAYVNAGGNGGKMQVFSDVNPDDWFYDGVMYLFDHGIVMGYGSERIGQFGPNDNLTNGQLASLLCRVSEIDTDPGDVEDKWVASQKLAIKAANDRGWMTVAEDSYDTNATRETAITALVKWMNVNVSTVNTDILERFNDGADVSDDNAPYIAYAVSIGLVNGTADGSLGLETVTTRGMFGVIMYRVLIGVDTTKMQDYAENVNYVTGGTATIAMFALLDENEPAAQADSKTLTLREDWRLTSNLDLNVPAGETLIISGGSGNVKHHIYEMGGILTNSGTGTVQFDDGTYLYPAEGDTDAAAIKAEDGYESWDEAASAELVRRRQPQGEAEAEVGGVRYATLAEAIAAAQEGEEVVLLKDVEIKSIPSAASYTGAITIDKPITLNGNGYAITAADDFGNTSIINVENSGEVTIKDLTVNGNGSSRHCINIFSSANTTSKSVVTLENVVTTKGLTGVTIGGSDVTVQGDKTNIANGSWGNAINVDSTGSSTNPASLTVLGGTVGVIYIENTAGTEEVKAEIKDGIVENVAVAANASNASAVVSGGNFANSINKEYLDTSLNAERKSASNPDAPYSYYTTVDAATKAAQPGDVVTALRESSVTYVTVTFGDGYFAEGEGTMTVPAGSTITLPTPSRNGYTFGGWSDGTKTYNAGDAYVVTGNVNLTAKWSSTGSATLPIIGGVMNGLGSQLQSPFVDVTPVDYYYDAVNWAVDNGITTGTGRLSFSPDEACTRAQAVTFLWRAAGSPAPKNAVTPFVDVDSSAYYAKAVAWAVENGVTNGTSATTFSPDEACTRAHIVTFLYRAFGRATSASTTFTDVAANAYYAPAVAWAAASGVTGGTGSGKFSPAATCTRAQIVTFLYRCCG